MAKLGKMLTLNSDSTWVKTRTQIEKGIGCLLETSYQVLHNHSNTV